MIDTLRAFLEACDRNDSYDLAGRALVLAIDQVLPPGALIPTHIFRACPKGIAALQNVRAGRTLTRAELRGLAELEHALEHPESVFPPITPEKEVLRALLASISNQFPPETQMRLARSLSDDPDDPRSIFTPLYEVTPLGRYAVVAAIAFSAFTGACAIPFAITFGGIAGWTAVILLAVVAFLAAILFRRA